MLFVHDHTFIKKDHQYYTNDSLNNTVFKRYVNLFGNVSVLATERTANSKDEKFICEQNKVDCVQFNLFKKTNNILYIINNRKIVKQIISEHNCLVIRLPSVYGIIAINYAKKLKKPYLVEVVGCPWDAFWNHSVKGKLVAPIMWLLTRKAVKNSMYTLYVTNKFLQSRYPSLGKNLACSDVSLPPLDESVLQNRIHKILKHDENEPIIIGTIGAVNVRYKGQQYVIKAISKLNKEGYKFKYYIVGGGDDSYLRAIAKRYNVDDKVKFLGSLPHEGVFEYLDNIDIYIQPSKTEGLPRAVVEAMSRACPCIGSDAGGLPELINSNLIFSKGSVGEICKLLKGMNKQIMLEEAKRNFNKAKEYDKELLNKKRSSFFIDFIEDSVNMKKDNS